MKKIWITIGIVVIILLLVGINVWKNNDTDEITVEVTTLKEKTVKDTVLTPGTLELVNQETIYLQPNKGEVAEVFVKEGEKVEKDTKLLRYENKQLTLEKKQNDLQIRSLYLQLDDVKKKHNDIDKQVKKDKDNEMLQDEHDQIELQQQQLNIDLEQALLQKESIEEQMGELLITSDIAGTVLTINEMTAPGAEQVQQSPLIQIGSLNDLAVEGLISEYDTLKISEGQNVTLTTDAVLDKSWEGKVGFISFLPNGSDDMMNDGAKGVQYPVEVIVEDKQIDLKPGFNMLIEIEIANKKANTLPLTAVKQDDDINYVYVVKNNVAREKEVEVGMVSGEEIEIKDGIGMKEKVVANPSGRMKDGMEVTLE